MRAERPTDCFREELAREWQFYQYPSSPGACRPRIVALQPPPLDAWITEALLRQSDPEIMFWDGYSRDIYISVENCTAHYKIDCRSDFGPVGAFGCHLVSATYTHRELPPRPGPR